MINIQFRILIPGIPKIFKNCVLRIGTKNNILLLESGQQDIPVIVGERQRFGGKQFLVFMKHAQFQQNSSE